MNMKIGNIKQIIIYVSDMDTQVKFYKKILGFDVIIPGNQDSYANEFWVQLNTGETSLCLHAGGNKDFGKDAPKFTFEVEDVNIARNFFIEKGIKVSEVRSPSPDHFVVDITDPEGNTFSLEQFP